VKAPNKKATVVQTYENYNSTVKKIKIAMAPEKIPIYLYSAHKKAIAPLSMYEAISNIKAVLAKSFEFSTS